MRGRAIRSGLLGLTALLAVTPLHAGDAAIEPRPAVKAPLAVSSLLLDGARAGSRLVAVGERGHVLYSDDAGASWRQAEVPTRATLTAVHFHDERNGWAVGHDAVILHTVDGGEHWAVQHFAPEEERPLLDVWFEDARHGYAVGAYGLFLETGDGGESWQARAISADDFHLNQIASAGAGRLYIAAEAGNVYRSDDGGTSWGALAPPYAGSFLGALALDRDRVIVLGLRGHLFRSDDAGESWNALDTGTSALLTAAVRLDDGTIVVTGLAGTLLVGDNDARSFRLVPRSDRRAIAGLVETVDGRLVLYGEFGVATIPRRSIER